MKTLASSLLLLAAILGLVQAAPAEAQRRTTWFLHVDNDFFALWQPSDRRPDEDYTQGLRLAVRKSIAAAVGGLFPRCEACQSSLLVELGQEIYTPEIDAPEPAPGQRPYAGWLGVGLGVARLAPGRAAAARIVVGVTGPPSLAGWAQTTAHRLLGFREPVGWRSQLPAEPGVYAEYEVVDRIVQVPLGPGVVQLATGAAARVGTIHTDGRLTARLSAGVNPATDGRSVSGEARPGPSFYGWIAGHVDGVARNEFLQGTAFRRSRGVPIRHVVPELEVGFSGRVGGVLLGATYFRRGREYPSQASPHAYVRLTAGLIAVGRRGD